MQALAQAFSQAALLCGVQLSVAALLSSLPDGRSSKKKYELSDEQLLDEFRDSLARFGIGVDRGHPGDDGVAVGWSMSGDENFSAHLLQSVSGQWRWHSYDARGVLPEQVVATPPENVAWVRVAPLVKQRIRSQAVIPAWLREALVAHRTQYVSIALAALMVNIFALVMPLFSMAVYDRIAPNAAHATLWTLATGVLVVLIFDFILRLLRAQLTEVAARRIDVLVSRKIFEHLLGLALGRTYAASGALADRLRGFQTVQEFFSSASLLVLVDLPFMVLFTGVIFIVGGNLGWIVLIFACVMLIISWGLQLPMSELSRHALIQGHERHSTLVETIGSLEAVRAVGAERMLRRRWRELTAAAALSNTQTRFMSALAVTASSSLSQIASLVLTVAGVYLIGAGQLSTGGLIATLMFAGRALTPITQISQLVMRFWQVRFAAAELNEFAKLPLLRAPGVVHMSRPQLDFSLQLVGISYTYPRQQDVGASVANGTTDRPALQELNLKINAGERVAILGRNGSGKSTLLKLMAGIYAPVSGAIRLGDVEITQLDPADVRRNIGYVTQEPVLFSGSIAENIQVGWPEASSEDLMRAATLAGVDEFVRHSSQGYHYRLGERGSGLSAGQRQALGIAQALVRDPGIFLLDEPTSAMDHTAEARFIQRLAALLNDAKPPRTLVVVTHRPQLLALVQRIVVVEAGSVVLDGPRDEVLRRLEKGTSTA